MFAVEWLMVLLLAEIQMKRTSVFLLFEPTVYYAVVAPFFFLDAKSLLCCVAFLFTFKRHFTYTITYNLSYRQEFQNITSWRIHLKYFLSLRSRMATIPHAIISAVLCLNWLVQNCPTFAAFGILWQKHRLGVSDWLFTRHYTSSRAPMARERAP